MKRTFAANTFKSSTFKSGTWTGVGTTPIAVVSATIRDALQFISVQGQYSTFASAQSAAINLPAVQTRPLEFTRR